MAIKVDLEKAYDKLRRDFIHDTPKDVGLPKEFIQIIIECITTARVQILWEGILPIRGIHQGGLLSRYIFVLCIESLSHGINFVLKDKRLCPICLLLMVLLNSLISFLQTAYFFLLRLLAIKPVRSIMCLIFFVAVQGS